MRAIVVERYGSFENFEVREVERPAVGEEEVLVRVRAASVHPDIWLLATGRPYFLRLLGAGLMRPKYRIPGTDMAGIVEVVGGGVTRFQPGDEVFGETTVAREWSTGGAYADCVSVRQDQLALKPANVTFEQAASVPTSGFITLSNLREGSRLSGRRVLINGAGGGVGGLALQIAKAYGAHVTAVDSPGKAGLLRSLGADRVVDHTREDFTQGSDRYDLIFDIPGNHPFSRCRRVLEPDGRYVLIGHERFGKGGGAVFGILPYFFLLVLRSRFERQLRGPREATPTRSESIALLRDLLAAGKLTPVIDSTYPLGQVREALRHLIEDELQGKVILTVG
jgi:NADPH:quinone reductase-like Zn-dependent oxidoreductase